MNKIKTIIVVIILILGVGVCYYSMTNPNFINKQVYILFGEKQFSNKKLTVNIVDEFNEKALTEIGRKKVTYFHKFTDEELSWIKSLVISEEFNSSDIELLSKVSEINIKDINITSEITFQDDLNLEKLYFDNVTLESLNIFNTDIKDIILSHSNINNLNANNNFSLSSISSYESYVNNATFFKNDNVILNFGDGSICSQINLYSEDENLSKYFENIKFNKLVIDKNKEISLPKDSYFYVNFDRDNFLSYSEGLFGNDYYLRHEHQIFKIEYNDFNDFLEENNVMINNLIVKVYDVDENYLETDKTEELNDIYNNIFDYDYIEFYDKDKLLISFGIDNYLY